MIVQLEVIVRCSTLRLFVLEIGNDCIVQYST